ncbi:hypothetical protein LEMLEM_LOCUS17934 [Lemmus lemmus]
MADNPNSHVNVKQQSTKPGDMGKKQDIIQQPEALPNTVMQQDPDNANQTNDVISTQTNDVANQGLEVNNQFPGTYSQGLEIHTQLPDVSKHSSLSAEVDRQNVLDAAEALLLLHNSPQVWQETSSTPGRGESQVHTALGDTWHGEYSWGYSGNGVIVVFLLSTPESWNQKPKWGSVSGPPTWNVTWVMRLESHWDSNLNSEDVQTTLAENTVVHPGPKPGENSFPHTLREHSYALPAPGSEKRVHGALLKRRQVRHPSTTRVVAHKALCQRKKSSAKARGDSEWVWLGREPGFDGREGQHEKNVSDGERKRKQAVKDKGHLQAMGSKGPIASDQTSVSATFECEEILEAAVALMTLKNSSWIWR